MLRLVFLYRDTAYLCHMSLRDQLSNRLGKTEIQQLCSRCKGVENPLKDELYTLIFDTDKRVSDNAAWVMTHMGNENRRFLQSHIVDLMAEAMHTTSESKCRLLLTLLRKQKFTADSIDSDFLDFCLANIIEYSKPVGIRAMCLHLAYEQCRFYPELTGELRLTLDLLDNSGQQAGMRSARRNTIKKIENLQTNNSNEK